MPYILIASIWSSRGICELRNRANKILCVFQHERSWTTAERCWLWRENHVVPTWRWQWGRTSTKGVFFDILTIKTSFYRTEHQLFRQAWNLLTLMCYAGRFSSNRCFTFWFDFKTYEGRSYLIYAFVLSMDNILCKGNYNKYSILYSTRLMKRF